MKCPICGHEVDVFDICDNCNYQNSGQKEKLDGPLGPNKMTIREAREEYKEGKYLL
ncbi:CPCC family cysteine-rich protein [Clostridium baratii]|uniref:CPCC family cysteine-rich protein n=1 Tax=Clostridium baratii TaxID=1561 RepID=UPI0030CF6DBD